MVGSKSWYGSVIAQYNRWGAGVSFLGVTKEKSQTSRRDRPNQPQFVKLWKGGQHMDIRLNTNKSVYLSSLVSVLEY